MNLPRALASALLLTGVAALAAPVTEFPYRRAAVPADGRLTLTDYDRRDWGPELVHYRLDTKAFVPGKLALLGPDGKAVPFQVEGDLLAFVASLPQGKSVTYTLVKADTDRSAENLTVRVTKAEKHASADILVSNEFLTLRLPNPEGEYDKTQGQAPPPPLVGWRTGDGPWRGDLMTHRLGYNPHLHTSQLFRLQVDARGAGYVVVADAIQTGWVARLDGERVNLRRADHALVAVYVPEGRHTIELVARPRGWRAGIALSLAALVVVVGLFAWILSRRYRRTRAARRASAARPGGDSEASGRPEAADRVPSVR